MMRTLAALSILCCSLLGACSAESDAPPNVLLIVIDTLRADHMSYAGYSRETTPHIDRLAERSVVFTHAQTPRAKTNPAVVSLMTGLYPHEHGVRDLVTPVSASIPTLAESYQAAGYDTAAIVGNYVLQKRWSGLARGFETWIEDFPQETGVPPDNVPQRVASSITDGALAAFGLRESVAGVGPGEAMLDEQKPWLLYLHYMDPHGLYDAPGEPHYVSDAIDPIPAEDELALHLIWKRNVAKFNVPASCVLADGRTDANAVRALYDDEIRYADAEIGRLLDELKRAGQLENTLIVITSDHGESLGEHRYWFEHGRYAYEATCRVPLVISAPGYSDRECADDISLCDLAPTLLELCGLSPLAHPANVVPDSPRGESRAQLLRGADADAHPVFSEKIAGDEREQTVQIKAVRIGDWKLIRRYAHRDPRSDDRAETERRMVILSEELYDLRSDPHEAKPLEEPFPDNAPIEQLAAELDRFLQAEAQFADLADQLSERRAALLREDPEREQRIRALGY